MLQQYASVYLVREHWLAPTAAVQTALPAYAVGGLYLLRRVSSHRGLASVRLRHSLSYSTLAGTLLLSTGSTNGRVLLLLIGYSSTALLT